MSSKYPDQGKDQSSNNKSEPERSIEPPNSENVKKCNEADSKKRVKLDQTISEPKNFQKDRKNEPTFTEEGEENPPPEELKPETIQLADHLIPSSYSSSYSSSTSQSSSSFLTSSIAHSSSSSSDRSNNHLPIASGSGESSNDDVEDTSLEDDNRSEPSNVEEIKTASSDSSSDERSMNAIDESSSLIFSWKDSNVIVPLEAVETVGDLKVVIYSLTAVPPDRQKILGLVPGKLPTDEVLLSTIRPKLTRGAHFKLLGTPEEDTILRPPEVILTGGSSSSNHGNSKKSNSSSSTKDCVLYLPKVQSKLDEISNCLEINIMNPPRTGKKLIVLDLDYTLMDSKAYSDYSVHALDMARPYLHEFLTAVWPYYDICVWSATNWRWLESKLIELGMVGGKYTENYLIQFVLDRDQMFEVTSMRHGKVSQHEVKALELIWRKIPVYNSTNTVHLDDLSRNFVLNPSSGVKISAFKNARENKHDRQLVFLARYFLQIATLNDIRTVDHKKWADCKLKLPEGVKDPLEILNDDDPELIKFKENRNSNNSNNNKHHHHHHHHHKHRQ